MLQVCHAWPLEESMPLYANGPVQHEFLISPHRGQIIWGTAAESVVDLMWGKLMTRYGAVKLECYRSTAMRRLQI
ncbi:hypothetical protein T265_07250 [Opisthorchis viverrini]|uniref:Uncharacterized protein n=1 Tax=Opisthorchis viverrini TaxID=6198 RepID=A0A075AC45_OPIVI|nr:hypothetical protein T265_07250 [Opisthorchis viverrini]KER25264.1 hypothetical protein T265_07250 [Opisthorchis viverrini]